MVSNRPSLLKQSPNKPPPSGPVFDFGPGWGQKLNKWIRKNVMPLSALLVFVFVFILIFTNSNKSEPEEVQIVTISQIVLRGDSYTHVARRTIAEYLENSPEEPLTPGQKVFIEERLWRKAADQSLVTGATLEFNITDIESLITQSKSLSPPTLQKWEEYAKNVRF